MQKTSRYVTMVRKRRYSRKPRTVCRFEKGVKQIECDIEGQRVTITYDADKTNSDAIIKSFDKFGYKATEVKTKEPAADNKK